MASTLWLHSGHRTRLSVLEIAQVLGILAAKAKQAAGRTQWETPTVDVYPSQRPWYRRGFRVLTGHTYVRPLVTTWKGILIHWNTRLCSYRALDDTRVLCYSIYTGMDFFWGSVRIILLATKATKVPGNTEWQYKLYVITVVAGTVFYLIACIVSNFLYRELRRILRELSEPHAWAPVEGSQGNDLNNQNPQEVGSVRYDSIGPEGDRFPGTAYKIGGQQSEKSRLVSESE
eukprot:1068629-Amorphochlora_amoeboformis.AAC.1